MRKYRQSFILATVGLAAFVHATIETDGIRGPMLMGGAIGFLIAAGFLALERRWPGKNDQR